MAVAGGNRNKMRYSQAENREQRIVIAITAFCRAGVYFLLYIGVPTLCMTIPYVLFHSDKTVDEFFIYGGNFYSTMGMLALLYGLYRVAKRRGLDLISGIPESFSPIELEKSGLFFVFGVMTALALSAAITLIGKIPIIGLLVVGYTESSQTMYSGYDLLFSLVTTVILTPIVEEVLFRGYTLDTLLQFFEHRGAVWICSIAFALCHVNLIWICYALVMGYLLTELALREDGIYYCVLCHFGFNLPSAFIYCINKFSPTGTAVMGNVVFLILLGGLTSYCAWKLYCHYTAQNQGYYESIWRKNP